MAILIQSDGKAQAPKKPINQLAKCSETQQQQTKRSGARGGDSRSVKASSSYIGGGAVVANRLKRSSGVARLTAVKAG
ncbi:hypothetical protein F2Q69_00027461 [Brassica cretica]|uniref:Uncharacterized protein n=1 Tax=Brassica cretica TaxID=69181 RepID=A0A8S9RU63_BRACR|nr:hypothetical protein F2Q69_00027461 [Brassica cretica]